jgi:hypothetical protein
MDYIMPVERKCTLTLKEEFKAFSSMQVLTSSCSYKDIHWAHTFNSSMNTIINFTEIGMHQTRTSNTVSIGKRMGACAMGSKASQIITEYHDCGEHYS